MNFLVESEVYEIRVTQRTTPQTAVAMPAWSVRLATPVVTSSPSSIAMSTAVRYVYRQIELSAIHETKIEPTTLA